MARMMPTRKRREELIMGYHRFMADNPNGTKNPISSAGINGTLNGLLDASNAPSWLLTAFSLDQKALNALLDRFVQLETQQENSALAVASAFVPKVRSFSFRG